MRSEKDGIGLLAKLELYYEARLPITGCHGGTYIYSLHLKDIQKREPAESPY